MSWQRTRTSRSSTDWQAYNKLAEKIRGLLTAEQKKALEAAYSAAQGYIDGIDKIVHLTDAQKKAVIATIEARDKAIAGVVRPECREVQGGVGTP